MFSNEQFEENRTHRIEAPDLSVDTCEHLLKYLYTGRVPQLDENAIDLFGIADKVCWILRFWILS